MGNKNYRLHNKYFTSYHFPVTAYSPASFIYVAFRKGSISRNIYKFDQLEVLHVKAKMRAFKGEHGHGTLFRVGCGVMLSQVISGQPSDVFVIRLLKPSRSDDLITI